MKNLLLVLIVSVLLYSCSDSKEPQYEISRENCTVCDSMELANARKFVSDNIKNANNMSDEEMEDVIEQLQWTSITLSCRKTQVTLENHNNTWIPIDLPKGTAYWCR